MKLEVNPTRMELLRLKKRLAMARRGHKLLKDKQDELMRQFMEMIRDIKELRAAVERSMQEAFQRFLFVSASMPRAALEEAVGFPSKRIRLDVSERIILNIKAPELRPTVEGEIHCYGLATTPGDLDLSLEALNQVLHEMIVLAQKEKWMHLLAEELVSTRRRVNSLEYVLIPNLEETIKFITMKLSEMERSNFSRLMKVKEIVRAH
ncbi:MAG: V-type ATP synthase subunit D [Deltaproteobacteria bacterium]|nr:V-type ATP synthase subunit D [Deltaproteobacteria bacterium]MBW2123456.1 V-type ATP synthase subunit D [Deltaproteobacteria bacterium]